MAWAFPSVGALRARSGFPQLFAMDELEPENVFEAFHFVWRHLERAEETLRIAIAIPVVHQSASEAQILPLHFM